MNFPTITLGQILITIMDFGITDVDRIKVLNWEEVKMPDPILNNLNDFGGGRIIFPPEDRQKTQLQRSVLIACLVVVPKSNKQRDNEICYWTILVYNDSCGNIFNKFLDIKVKYTWSSRIDFIYYETHWSLDVPWILWLGENEIEVRIDTITHTYPEREFGHHKENIPNRQYTRLKL